MNKLKLENTSFEEALRKLDEYGEGFLALVDEDDKLIGVITDGDIRRAILNKKTDLDDVINKKPIVAQEGISILEARKILKESRRRHLPVVNSENILIDIVKLDDWNEYSRRNKIVIMAGGLGSRLEDLTKEIPKPMLPVGNRPILEHIILNFMHQGFLDFILAVNYKSEVIKEYFGSGRKLGVNIEYVEENERKGTAGALSLITADIKDPFIVINGDILTAIDFTELLKYHIEKDAAATMCLVKKSYSVQYGVVEIDEEGYLESIEEKPSYNYFINAGIYVFNPKVLDMIPKEGYFDMNTLIDLLREKKMKVAGHNMKDYWLDIGLKKDYYQAVDEIKNKPI